MGGGRQGRLKATLLCWNVAGRVGLLPEQADLVARAQADIVCLQEVAPRTRATWTEALLAAGYPHVAVASAPPDADRNRPLSALTASRRPLRVVSVRDVPWPERVLGTEVDGLQLINVHSPTSTRPRLAKVLTHEAVFKHLVAGSGPRAVCGDLNTPRKEHADGRVWTFAWTQHGKLRPERGQRHDRAELALIRGLEPHGFRDAFRDLRGFEVRELSWEWQRWGGGYRLDHLIASDEVAVSEVLYLHPWRQTGLSDHSPLFARLQWLSRP